jgi:serine/threonine protein kinase
MEVTGEAAESEAVVQRAVDRKLITEAQVAECREIQGKLVEMGLRPRSLEEILNEKGYLEAAALEKLKIELSREAGEVIPGYKLLERLGRGSMGVVYRAHQRSLDRVVAIKILFPELSRNPDFVARFLREARTVARLSHPNIVAGYDAGEAGGYHFFVMEYVDGPTVREVVRRGGPLSEERAVHIGVQVTSALAHAYDHGLVHKDIKPDNILLAEGGAKLCDLGLVGEVGQTRADGSIVGTPHYIPPEMIRGDPADIRSDLYSLGATIFFMLTGRPPFDGNTPAAVLAKHMRDPVPDPCDVDAAIDVELGRIVQRLLAKDPSARYQTPASLLAELASR